MPPCGIRTRNGGFRVDGIKLLAGGEEPPLLRSPERVMAREAIRDGWIWVAVEVQGPGSPPQTGNGSGGPGSVFSRTLELKVEA
jgi:hypothetical protein